MSRRRLLATPQKKGVIALISMLLAYSALASDSISFELDGHTLHIPEEYVVGEQTSWWGKWLLRSDDDRRSILFRIKAKEVRKHIKEYQTSDGTYRDDIEGLIIALEPDEKVRYRSSRLFSDLDDLWFGRASYENREVVQYNDKSLFKVYRKSEYPYSWALLSTYPDSTKPLPSNPLEFWVAHCLEVGRPSSESGKGIMCQSYALAGDFVIEFDVSEYNLDVISEVRTFLQKSVLSWKEEP